MKKAARKKKESFFEKQEVIVEEVIVEEKKALSSKMKILTQRKYQVGLLVLIIIVVGALVAGYGFVNTNTGTDGGKLSPSQINSLISEVGDKMMIPKGETPTIATVTDVTKLENQPFFRNAQNGDKVMIFGSTNTAILYRPSIHKIVTVAPINAQTNPVASGNNPPPTGTPSGTITPTPNTQPIKVVILNGTKVAGLAKKAESLIKSESVNVVSLGNTFGDYAISSISNVSKPSKITDEQLQRIVNATKVKAKIITLPAGETAPEGVDVVLILGKDFADSN
jgi:hypothetical protein